MIKMVENSAKDTGVAPTAEPVKKTRRTEAAEAAQPARRVQE